MSQPTMGLRETITGKSGRLVITGAAVLAIGFTTVFVLAGGSNAPVANKRAFFSDDDGKTWFADDAAKLPPFDHNGKQAVRAYVFRSAKGVDFVNALERFQPEARAMIERAAKPNVDQKSGPDQAALQKSQTAGREMKRPGDVRWISGANYREASQITTIKCPDGSTEATPVEP